MSQEEQAFLKGSPLTNSITQINEYLASKKAVKFVTTEDNVILPVTDENIKISGGLSKKFEKTEVLDSKITGQVCKLTLSQRQDLAITSYERLKTFTAFVKDVVKSCPTAAKDMSMGHFDLFKKCEEDLFRTHYLKKNLSKEDWPFIPN